MDKHKSTTLEVVKTKCNSADLIGQEDEQSCKSKIPIKINKENVELKSLYVKIPESWHNDLDLIAEYHNHATIEDFVSDALVKFVESNIKQVVS